MTGITCAVAGSGSYISTVVVTVGYQSAPGIDIYGYNILYGSITPNTFGPYNISDLSWNSLNEVYFRVDGIAPNAGWQTIDVNGVTYNRTDATYVVATGTAWTWTSVTNPFGTTVGATKTVTWI